MFLISKALVLHCSGLVGSASLPFIQHWICLVLPPTSVAVPTFGLHIFILCCSSRCQRNTINYAIRDGIILSNLFISIDYVSVVTYALLAASLYTYAGK